MGWLFLVLFVVLLLALGLGGSSSVRMYGDPTTEP